MLFPDMYRTRQGSKFHCSWKLLHLETYSFYVAFTRNVILVHINFIKRWVPPPWPFPARRQCTLTLSSPDTLLTSHPLPSPSCAASTTTQGFHGILEHISKPAVYKQNPLLFYTRVQVPTVFGSSYLKGCTSPAKHTCTKSTPYKPGRAQPWAGPGRGQFGHSLGWTPCLQAHRLQKGND